MLLNRLCYHFTGFRKKIVRIITFSDYTSHSLPIFHNLKILPLEYLYELNLGITFYKIKNNMITTGTHNLTSINEIHNYNTRLSQSQNYFQFFNRINIGQSTYTSKGLKFWRELPPELKSLSFLPFKHNLKNHLFKIIENTI